MLTRAYTKNSWRHLMNAMKTLKAKSITLAGSKLVRSWSQTCSALKFGISFSLLAAN